MNDADIKGHVLAIAGAVDGLKKIEARASKARSMADVAKIKEEGDELKEVALKSAIELTMNLLVNINDIAEAMKFSASTAANKNTEALFRG